MIEHPLNDVLLPTVVRDWQGWWLLPLQVLVIPLQPGDVHYRMSRTNAFRKFQPICNWANRTLDNAWSKKPGLKLWRRPLHVVGRTYVGCTYEHLVPGLKLFVSTMAVGIQGLA